MGIITSYPDDTTTTDNDKFLTVDSGGTTKLTAALTLKSYLLTTSALLGWVPASGTWTYISATTMTVPSADAALMSVGTKLWLTQTSSKYFYVIGISGTTITFTGGTDYSLANATITSPNFSNALTPVGFPSSFNWAPTMWSNNAVVTGATTGGGILSGKFTMTGKIVTFNILHKLGTTTSYPSSGTLEWSQPVASRTITADEDPYTIGNARLTRSGIAHMLAMTSLSAGGRVYLFYSSASNSAGSITNGIPYAWATNDTMSFTGTYNTA